MCLQMYVTVNVCTHGKFVNIVDVHTNIVNICTKIVDERTNILNVIFSIVKVFKNTVNVGEC